MSRKFVVVAVMVALVSVLDAGAAPRKVIYHYHWSAQEFDEINIRAAKLFMASNPEVEVRVVFLPDADRVNVIRTVIAAGKRIDSFSLDVGESAELLAAGRMVPIIPAAFGKRSVEDVIKMWTPGAFEACGGYWDGQYYGIPFELSNYVAWINTSDMREAGLDPARDIPKTWEQFVEVGRKLKKIRDGSVVRNGFMCNTKAGVFNFLVLLAMMEQLGLDWGTEKGLVASMDQPAVLARGLKTYTDFVTVSRIWDPSLAEEDRAGFGTSKAAMFLTGGSWYWGLLEDFPVKRMDVEPFPYPRFAGGRDIGGVGYGYCLYVSKLSKDPTLTFRFLDALASQPNEFIVHGYYQPRLKLSDGTQALDPSLAGKHIPYFDQVFKSELSKTAVWLSSTKGTHVTDCVWQAIVRVIYQGVSVDDSVAKLQRSIKDLFRPR